MAVNFTELLENAELTDDVKSALQEAWDGKISEAREELTAELREEFAQRYDHDKSQIVEAVDNFISEKVEAEIQGIAEEKTALASDRVKYTKAISEHAKVLDKFVTEMVAKEVKELREGGPVAAGSSARCCGADRLRGRQRAPGSQAAASAS